MIACQANLRAVLHVAHNMREWDRREIFACRWDDSPDNLAMDVVRSGYAFTLGKDEPIAVLWAAGYRPNVWSIGMFATDRFREIAVGATKFAKRVFIKGIVESGAIRADAKSMDGHNDAHGWMKILGAEYEGTQKYYGKNGETFHTFAWTKGSPKYPFWR